MSVAVFLDVFNPMGAVIGLLGSVGVWLVIWRVMAIRPNIAQRLEPYLNQPAASSRVLSTQTPFPQLERMVLPVVDEVSKVLNRIGSQTHSVKHRLLRANTGQSVEEFRVQQVIWATVGVGVGLFIALLLATTRHAHIVPLLALIGAAGLSGALGRDRLLTRQVRKREEAMAQEFPTIAEFLALSVSAGETPLAALERVTTSTAGVLAVELNQALADVRSGITLNQALHRLANRTEVTSIIRFSEGVATAVERGTPLAEVLRAQAEDARDGAHQALMEIGGKKEITMMIPVVFLLLPITVLFALFPGIHMLAQP